MDIQGIEPLIFLLIIALMLLINSLMIRGINLVVDGHTEILPDGREVNRGKVGYPIRKYFDKSHVEKVYYREEELRKLLKILEDKIPHIMQYRESFFAGIYVTKEQLSNILGNKKAILLNGNCELDHEEKGEIIQVFFYKNITKYHYPEWFRMTVYSCAPCMSSVYGTLFYWVFMLYIMDLNFSRQLFCVWLGYWLSLAYVNHLIEKR